jgi:hypothetical protein
MVSLPAWVKPKLLSNLFGFGVLRKKPYKLFIARAVVLHYLQV